jgi:hypothetical protein
MDREAIISMANQTNLGHMFHSNEDASPGMCRPEDIEKLAALVAKQVRDDYSNKHANLWIKRIDEAVKAEREVCAQMVDHILKEGGGTYGDAIRARGER